MGFEIGFATHQKRERNGNRGILNLILVFLESDGGEEEGAVKMGKRRRKRQHLREI